MDGDLKASARKWGIEPSFYDVFGNCRVVADDVLRRVIAALSSGRSEPATVMSAIPGEGAFQGDRRRLWGLAVQLYAVRSRRNLGIGDFRDLHDIISIAVRSGAGAIGLNPLHALFSERPEMASPYAPNSRLFLNPLYIALDDLEWFNAADVNATDAGELRDKVLVDYPRVAELKLAALRATYDRFCHDATARHKERFNAFRVKRGDGLKRFACFEVLRKRHAPRPWWDWPAPFSNPSEDDIAQVHDQESAECGFHEFLQWTADRQLADCQLHAIQSGLQVGLYLDLAVGAEPSGADAWCNQRSVVTSLSIGAPPDELNREGQNWGLVPFNPHALPDNDFAVFRELLSATMAYAGAVRLDHVLGLMRLYLIPRGASEGAYVTYPFEQLLRVIAEESHKYRCNFIGEDLGTVPEGFRETVARWGVWSYRVMMFERMHGGVFKPPEQYPDNALATFNTHDLPTFAGWMSGDDLRAKRALGLLTESDDDRARDREAIHGVLTAYAENGHPGDLAAATRFLAATPSRLVTISVEDILGVSEQINIPGTVEQHPNWRRKLPVLLEEWEKEPMFSQVADIFRRAGRSN
jgi:4-alpha-glucanotransferase